MVMLNYRLDDINKIIGKKLSLKTYDELAFNFGLDLEIGEDVLNFEITSDRTDIVSKYSLANVLANAMNVKIKRYLDINKENSEVFVYKTIRPFVNVLHVKLLKKIGNDLQELINMQERLDKNIGRNRHKSAIGLFDYSKIEFPITYHEENPKNVKFVPLGYKNEKTYSEIIKEVEQAKEYSSLVTSKPIVWTDKSRRILAMPPIINSDYYSVSEDTDDLLVDITGTDRITVNAVTKILIHNFQFIGRVSLLKVYYKQKSIDTGLSFKTHQFTVNSESVKSLLGIELSKNEIIKILSRLDYSLKENGKDLLVAPPFYRQDIMHQVDIVDDLMRVIGVNNIKEIYPHSYSDGSFLYFHYKLKNIRDVAVGLGYQEIDINTLTNERYQFQNTFIKAEDYVSLLKLKSGDVTMAAKNVFPELLRLISNNLHKKFPQNVFSISNVIKKSDSDVIFSNSKRLSIVSCSKDVNLTDILSAVKKIISDSFNADITAEINYDFKDTFIPGRSYRIAVNGKYIGFVGEIHPRVLNAFGIELPASIAEIYLDELLV